MPTPDDETTSVPPTPPLATSSSHVSFASCPPEEDREPHAPREARVHTPQLHSSSAMLSPDAHATSQEPTPDHESRSDASQRHHMQENTEKGEHLEDAAAIAVESPSPIGSPETLSDGDVRLAHSMDSAALAVSKESETVPRYLHYPPLNRNTVFEST